MADLNVVLSAIIMFETLELNHKLLRHSNGRSSGGGPANETQEKQRNNDKSTDGLQVSLGAIPSVGINGGPSREL